MDEAAQAVLGRAINDEILGCLTGTGELRAYARIIRDQGTVGEIRPVPPNGHVERCASPRVDLVIEAIDPFDIGSEAHPAREVEGKMDTEAALDWSWIDQPTEGRPAKAAEIVAASKHQGRHTRERIVLGRMRKRLRPEACCVDDCITRVNAAFSPPEMCNPSCGCARNALYWRFKGEHTGVILYLAEQRQHQPIAIDDSGRARVKRRDAG